MIGTEAMYSDSPAGMKVFGVLPPEDQELLQSAYRESLSCLAEDWQRSLTLKKVFWINLWQRSNSGSKVPLQRIVELDSFSRELADSVYGKGCVEFDGYGWIVNPVGSEAQVWHVDYASDYSTIFIPLSDLTEDNCLQYAVLPPDTPPELIAQATANTDKVDMELLRRESAWVSIRQLIARPFSIVKLDFMTIHRGIANVGDFDRVLFWISVKKMKDLLPAEPLVQRIVV
jgi:hypothetical protein